MSPTVGRIVHYHTAEATIPGIVTGVYEDTHGHQVDLTVFPRDNSPVVVTKCDEGTIPGTWSWPPRVDG